MKKIFLLALLFISHSLIAQTNKPQNKKEHLFTGGWLCVGGSTLTVMGTTVLIVSTTNESKINTNSEVKANRTLRQFGYGCMGLGAIFNIAGLTHIISAGSNPDKRIAFVTTDTGIGLCLRF